MADSKISALPAATVPLAGTEVLPIVQSATTRQVSVANLTAGRAISASSITNSALTSGRVTYAGASGLLSDNANFVFDNANTRLGIGTSSPACILDISGASGGQIKFPATQNASSNANTLDDYEEGTWTPTDNSGAGLTFTINSSQYTKIGRAVTINFEIVWPVTVDVNTVSVSLPFTPNATNSSGLSAFSNVAGEVNIYTFAGANFNLYNDTGVAITNATMSGKYLIVSLTYFTT